MAESRVLVEEMVRQVAEKGERLVALLRALMFTTTSVAGFIVTSMLDGEEFHLLARMLLRVGPVVLVTTWAWWWFVSSRPYRRLYGIISIVGDVVSLSAGAFAGSLLLGDHLTTMNAVGAGPPLLGLFFVLAAASLRVDLLLCLLAGGLAIVLFGSAMAVASMTSRAAAVDPVIAFYASPAVWAGRGVILAFATVLSALGARNARRVAEATGNTMADRARVVQLFGRYVDSSIAQAAIGGGDGATTREITVLFTDLRGFTTIAEGLDPSETLALLNAHYATIVPIVHRHGGTVNKFIGDAVMATFGAPEPLADHAGHAVRAASAMLEAQGALNARLRGEGRRELDMVVGIATGPVITGRLGAADRVEYAVIGDTVNTAARLEALSKEIGARVLFSERTRQALHDGAIVVSLGERLLKGKEKAVCVYTLAETKE